MPKDHDQLQNNRKSAEEIKPMDLKASQDRLAHEIRRAFIEQQSNIVNEINNSINSEQAREKNES